MTTEKPIEIERKFRIDNFRPEFLPQGTIRQEVVQYYLVTTEGGPERRIRVTEKDGLWVYDYTEKWLTNDPRKRPEVKQKISISEFMKLYREEHDPACAPVRKLRHSFPYMGHIWEIDKYHDIELGGTHLYTAEAELGHEDEHLIFPPLFSFVEITKNPEYKNRRIAELIKLRAASQLIVLTRPSA